MFNFSKGLNPCSNGSTILGLMKNATSLTSMKCLNPCSNGSTILGIQLGEKRCEKTGVLILVLMEVLFWVP